MRWTLSLLLIGFSAGNVHAQANPDPAVSHPAVCKNGVDGGPAGTCVPFDPNNPEHRKLLDKMNQTPPDIRSAPPVLPPPEPPDQAIFVDTTNFKTPPLLAALSPTLVPKPPTTTAPAPYCDAACSEAKLHRFDSSVSQQKQIPAGAGALWGVGQAMNQRQETRQSAEIQQQERELRKAQDAIFAIKSDRERLKADLNALQQIRDKYIFQPLDTVPSEVVKAFDAYRRDVCKIHQKWAPNEDVADLVRDLHIGFPSCQEILKTK